MNEKIDRVVHGVVYTKRDVIAPIPKAVATPQLHMMAQTDSVNIASGLFVSIGWTLTILA